MALPFTHLMSISFTRATQRTSRGCSPSWESIDAVFRAQPDRRIRPASDHLSGPGHWNLITRYGPLDVLGTIGRDQTYENLLPVSGEMDIGAGIRIHVINLETIIAVKESIDGEKDRLVLPVLRRTLAEKKGK